MNETKQQRQVQTIVDGMDCVMRAEECDPFLEVMLLHDVYDAMQFYAAQASEKARQEERERHKGMVDYLKMRAVAGGRVSRAMLIAAGYLTEEQTQNNEQEENND